MEGTVDEDAGAMIRDGIKSVAKQGAPHEPLWPYAIAKFRREAVRARRTPTRRKHPAVLYQRVTQDIGAAARLPGRRLSRSSSASPSTTASRATPSPASGTRADAGAGASRCSAATPCWPSATTTPRSGSSSATRGARRGGKQGYFTMPYAYLLDANLSDDFWTIKLVQ